MAHLRDAIAAYAEARSPVGEPTPEAYFTHRFGDFRLSPWAMLAVDASAATTCVAPARAC